MRAAICTPVTSSSGIFKSPPSPFSSRFRRVESSRACARSTGWHSSWTKCKREAAPQVACQPIAENLLREMCLRPLVGPRALWPVRARGHGDLLQEDDDGWLLLPPRVPRPGPSSPFLSSRGGEDEAGGQEGYRIFNTWMGDPSKLVLLEAVVRTVNEQGLLDVVADAGAALLTGLDKLQVLLALTTCTSRPDNCPGVRRNPGV